MLNYPYRPCPRNAQLLATLQVATPQVALLIYICSLHCYLAAWYHCSTGGLSVVSMVVV